MTSDYKSFGCFIDNSNNIFPTNITNITGKSYSIEECAQQAINNKSMAFGITGKYPGPGTCLLSDPNLNNLQQVYNSVKEGLVFDGCPENFGDKDKNSVSVFINNKSFSFFNDLNVAKQVEQSTDSFINQLVELNNNFEVILKQFDKSAINDFKPYVNNDIATLFNATNSSDYANLKAQYKHLHDTIQNQNQQLFTNIQKLNEEIQNIDGIRVNAEERLQFILNSDNAALGNVSDINFRANTVVIENIALILVAFILVVLCAIPKGSTQVKSTGVSIDKK